MEKEKEWIKSVIAVFISTSPPPMFLFMRIYLAHTRNMHICFLSILQTYLMSSYVLSKSLLTQPAWWCFYDSWPVSKSKPRHKLARLPAFKENTLINSIGFEMQVLCLKSAGAGGLNIFSSWKITCTLIPLPLYFFFHSQWSLFFFQLNKIQHLSFGKKIIV